MWEWEASKCGNGSQVGVSQVGETKVYQEVGGLQVGGLQVGDGNERLSSVGPESGCDQIVGGSAKQEKGKVSLPYLLRGPALENRLSPKMATPR